MSNPQYFRERALKYRKLAGNTLYAKHGDELRNIATLFDGMADIVRDHDTEASRLQHKRITEALEGVLSNWMNEIGSVM